jgi:arabinofuranan 3-O-arabinosyltransferase
MIEVPRSAPLGAAGPDDGGPPEITSQAGQGTLDEQLGYTLRLVACCLLLAMLAFVTRPGSILADTKIDMAVDPADFLRRALHLWDPAQFGQLQDQAVGYFFPMGPFFVLGKLIALPAWVVQRLWLTAISVAAFLGVVRLAARLGIGTPGSRIVAGLAYALAPRALTLLGVNSGELLPVAILPLILIPLVRLMRHGPEMDGRARLRAVAQSAVAVALASGMNAASIVAVLTVVVIYVLTGEHAEPRWRVLACWCPAAAAGTCWWTIPLLLQGKYGVSILPYSESAAITTSVTSLTDTLRGTEDWTSYLVVNGLPWWPVGFAIATGVLPTILTGVVSGLGLGGLLGRRMPERRFVLCALLAGLLIVGGGYVSGLGNPLAAGIDHLINGPLAPLRNVRKFDPLIRLPIALGVAHLLASVRRPRVRTAVLGATAAALALLVLPAATSGLSQGGEFPRFPGYWVSAVGWLNAHATNQAVLEVPGARFGEYTWGRPMDDVMEALYSGDWASAQLSAIGSVGNTRLLDAIEQRVDAGEGSPGLTQLLARMGVRYIVVRNDLIRSDLYGAWPARIIDALDTSAGIAKVAQFGAPPASKRSADSSDLDFDAPYPPVEIYQVAGARAAATVVPAADTMRVYGGPESLLTLADQGVLRGQPVLLNSDSARLPARQEVVTDSLRRIMRNFGEIRTDYTQTLTAHDPLSTIEAAADYLEPSWLSAESVAQYHGIADVTASSSASDINALPDQSATGAMSFAAIDGDPRTMWESGSPDGPVGQWLQVDLGRAVQPGVIRVAFGDSALLGPAVTKVTVQTAAGAVTDRVVPGARLQSLASPPGPTTWLRITVTGVLPEAYSLDGAQVGISQLVIPGVHATRTIMAPAITTPGGTLPSVSLSKAQPQPSSCMLTSLRWVCSPSLATATEEQYGFDEGFAAPRGYRGTLSGEAILTSGRLLARYGWPGRDQPRVTATSTYTDDPEDMASAAFDGSLATAWISAATDQHPVLTIRWPGVRTVRGISVIQPPGGRSLAQVYVTDPAGQVGGGFVGRTQELTFSRPMRTDQLRLAFSSSALPLQISEVAIPGVSTLRVTAAAPVRLRCGIGPTVRVDGTLVPTRVAGTYADLLNGRPMQFTACAAAPVRAGRNAVTESATDKTGWDVQDVLVSPPGASAAAGPSRPATAITWTDSRRVLRVTASQRSYLVVDQNFNAGWQASIGGRVLAPARLDGWEQAWLLPAGTRGPVTLTFRPDRPYRAALFGGLAALAVLIGIAAVPRRRRPLAAGQARPDPGSAAGQVPARPATATGRSGTRSRLGGVTLACAGLAGLAFAGLWLGGWPGAILLPAATCLFAAARWCLATGRAAAAAPAWRALCSGWLALGLMLAAATAGAIGYGLLNHGATGTLVTVLWDTGPQLLCLIVVGRICTELIARGPGPAG